MAEKPGKKEKATPLTDREEDKDTKTQQNGKNSTGEKKKKEKRDGGFFYEAMPVIFLAIGTFLGICIYTDTNAGVVGAFFQRGFFGLIGGAAYAVPPLFLYAAIRFRRDHRAGRVLRKCLFSVFAVVAVSVMLYTFGIPDAEKRIFSSFFDWGIGKRGGGVIGDYIGFGLNYTVSKAGTVILAVLFAVLFAIFFFDFNLAKFCRRAVEAIRRSSMERREKRIAYARERAREKARETHGAAGAFYGESAEAAGPEESGTAEKNANEKKHAGEPVSSAQSAGKSANPFLFPARTGEGERQFYDAENDDGVFDEMPRKTPGGSAGQAPFPLTDIHASAVTDLRQRGERKAEREEEGSYSDAAKEAKDRRIRELQRDFAAEDPLFTVEKVVGDAEGVPENEKERRGDSADTPEKGYAFSFDDETDFPSVEIVGNEPIPEQDGDFFPVVEKMAGEDVPHTAREQSGAAADPFFSQDGAQNGAFASEEDSGGSPVEKTGQSSVSDRNTPVFDEPSGHRETVTPPPAMTEEETGKTADPVAGGLRINEAHVISHSGLNSFEDKAEEKPRYVYQFPPLSLLHEEDVAGARDSDEEIKEKADRLISTLQSFNVQARISCVSRGPRLTRYELVPEVGVRIRSIENLVNEIAMNLEAVSVRIEAPIPGKAAIGVEVPNNKYSTVRLRGLLDTEEFRTAPGKTTVCLGVDVVGVPVFADLDKMPHLLVAGATGMGKSVCINSILVSLLYKARPDEVKLILIDPKKVEFKSYSNIPHLLVPVVTDAQKAAGALSWAVNEMERRYDIIEEVGVRNIKAYNKTLAEHPERERIPQIVIVIDELHDLMMQAPDAVEDAICRIAQKARAAGILLIIGTQRPSVNVITGVIKANIPSRIAFHVASQVDSRTILDTVGAEKLLNDGDMLFLCPGMKMLTPKRIQGAFLDDDEVNRVAEYLRTHSSGVEYDEGIMADMERETEKCNKDKKGAIDLPAGDGAEGGEEELFYRAVEVALENGKISTSLLQRKLSLGFGKAARMIDRMQEMGIVSPPNGQKPRDVLITADDYRAMRLRNDE